MLAASPCTFALERECTFERRRYCIPCERFLFRRRRRPSGIDRVEHGDQDERRELQVLRTGGGTAVAVGVRARFTWPGRRNNQLARIG